MTNLQLARAWFLKTAFGRQVGMCVHVFVQPYATNN